jgi:hypothetical protein
VGTAVLMWLVHAELILTTTIPASYDLTGHILPIAELKQRLLPQGRVHGWSADWFAGFPLYYFYFPLPALTAAVLSFVLSLEAAVKVTSVLGMFAFPFGLYVLFRALVLPRGQAAIAAAVSSTFLLMQSFWFLGGNIASTVAGEFAYSMSLTLSLFYLATLLRSSPRPTSFVLPALLLAGVALSHLVTTIAIVGVSAVLLRDAGKRRTVLLSWVAAFLLSAFWTVPFVLRHGEMATVYAHATRSFQEVMPLEMWPVLTGALAGAVVAWHYRPARLLLYISASGVLFYFIAGGLVYPGRFLPFWYLGAHMLAGFAVASALRGLGRTKTIMLIAVTVLPLVLLNAVRGVGYLREWSGSAYGGLQRRDSWRELQPLFAELAKSEGRIYWEQAPQQLSALGSRNLAAVTPYIARGQQVVNGLWLESSRLHDEMIAIDSAIARARYDGRQLDIALGKMSELGVTRFIALTPATAQLLMQRGAPVQATSQSFAVFAVPAKPLIESRTGDVQILEWSNERVRFRTTSPGAPHVVRMSWFPNWRAYGAALQRGANGMMLVTPRQSDVELRFERTFVELAGAIISMVAVLALAITVVSGRRDLRKTPG